MTRFRTPRQKASSQHLKKSLWNPFKGSLGFLFNRRAIRAYLYGMMAALVCASLFGAWKWMSDSSFFNINAVTVKGNSRLSSQEILKVVQTRMDTVNIFSLDLHSIAQELEKEPWIKMAVIKRNLPDKLEIHVKEYTPMALVGTDKLYLVDGEGIIFKEYVKGETEIMPVITGLSADQIKDGKLPEYAEKALFVIKFAKEGLRTLGINNIGRIHFNTAREMIVYTLNQGIAIRFGSLEKFKEKGFQKALIKFYNRAESILYHVFKSGRYKDVASIDLDYAGNMAVLRYKN